MALWDQFDDTNNEMMGMQGFSESQYCLQGEFKAVEAKKDGCLAWIKKALTNNVVREKSSVSGRLRKRFPNTLAVMLMRGPMIDWAGTAVS